MDTNLNTEERSRPPLWKQALGAIGGALVALGIYTMYTEASPQVTAWLSIPWPNDHRAPSGEVTVLDVDDYDAQDRIAAKAREIADRFSTRPMNVVEGEEEEEDGRELAQTDTSDAVPEQPPYRSMIQQMSSASSSAASMESSESFAESSMSEPMASSVAAEGQSSSQSSMTHIARVPELPSSGIGMWIVGIAAFLAAIGYRFRKELKEELIRLR